jgi:hypothetical protein
MYRHFAPNYTHVKHVKEDLCSENTLHGVEAVDDVVVEEEVEG